MHSFYDDFSRLVLSICFEFMLLLFFNNLLLKITRAFGSGSLDFPVHFSGLTESRQIRALHDYNRNQHKNDPTRVPPLHSPPLFCVTKIRQKRRFFVLFQNNYSCRFFFCARFFVRIQERYFSSTTPAQLRDKDFASCPISH